MPTDDTIEVDLYRDVVMLAVGIVRRTFRVALPARARSFARDSSQVAVDFMSRFLGMDRTARDEPPIDGISVITPRGGGYGLYYDVRAGDPMVLLACDGPCPGTTRAARL